MKFWEALREMERGAECTHGFYPNGAYRLHDGRLEIRFDGSIWNSTTYDFQPSMNSDWRIVTPAPTKQEAEHGPILFVDPPVFAAGEKALEAYRANIRKEREEDAAFLESIRGAKSPAPSEAKPEPRADDCKSDTLGYLKGAPYPKPFDTRLWGNVSSDDAYPQSEIKELSKRVEAVEKFCAANADSHQGVLERVEALESGRRAQGLLNDICGDRLSALEAKLAALDEKNQNLGIMVRSMSQSSNQLLLADASRHMDIKNIEERIAALEASKAQEVVNVTEMHNDMATRAKPMSLGEVAWPKGSLQWAEVEAKRMGLTRVRRASIPKHWRGVSITGFVSQPVQGRHALDWEPCE